MYIGRNSKLEKSGEFYQIQPSRFFADAHCQSVVDFVLENEIGHQSEATFLFHS
jgi:hypothetical protein